MINAHSNLQYLWTQELLRSQNDLRPSANLREVVVADSEFYETVAGDIQTPVCIVLRCLISGDEHRIFFDKDSQYPPCPLKLDDRVLFVAFSSQAELLTMLLLGWSLPTRMLDLEVEWLHLNNEESRRGELRRLARSANARHEVSPLSLLGVCCHFGIDIQSPERKEEMRQLILGGHPYSPAERLAILEYCAEDVAETVALLGKMWQSIPDPRAAIYRGRSMTAFARMRHVGLPMDVPMIERLNKHLDRILHGLREDVAHNFPVFNDDSLDVSPNKFAAFLKERGWYESWPKKANRKLKRNQQSGVGRPKRDAETLERMGHVYPELAQLSTFTAVRSQTKTGLRFPIGSDARCRGNFWAFGSVTSRCQPSSKDCPLVASSVWRYLLKPERGTALVEFDWAAQEFWIAAYLSNDPVMKKVVNSGDPYVAFAHLAGFLPADASKDPATSPYPREIAIEHVVIRNRFKAIALGVLYGKTHYSLAQELGITPEEAKAIVREHKKLFKRYWIWIDGTVGAAFLTRKISTKYGWVRTIRSARQRSGELDKRGNPKKERNSLQNHPMQSHGAEILRIAIRRAADFGVRILAPLHDAIFAEIPISSLQEGIQLVVECMAYASMAVIGAKIPVEKRVVKHPNRYEPKKLQAQETWERIQTLLLECEAEEQAPSANIAQ